MLALESYRDAVDALLMSAEWRTAGLAFLDAVHDRRDLGRWLVGRYRSATSYVPRQPWSVERSAIVDDAEVCAIVTQAHDDVLAALRAARWGNGPAFVQDAIRSYTIIPTLDGFWIPLDAPRMRLRDRVLALFAADYLLRPRDYKSLAICARCERVVFDPAAGQTGQCGAHRIRGFVRSAGPRLFARMITERRSSART
jgi:hypothetical protein